jgi:hypothetical protein
MVECSVCGEDIGRMGMAKHSGMHKREFREAFGREPEDYDEVRDALGGDPPGDATSLTDFSPSTEGGSDGA